MIPRTTLGSINKIHLSHLVDFDPQGWESLKKSVKKGNLLRKNFFQVILNEVLESSEK